MGGGVRGGEEPVGRRVQGLAVDPGDDATGRLGDGDVGGIRLRVDALF